MHQVLITGNVGSQPKRHKFDSGKEVLEFSVAETFIDKDNIKTTIWHDIKVWGPLVNVPIDSGSFVFIIGKLRYNKFQDKDNKTVIRSYILAEKLFPIMKLDRGQIFDENANPFLTS